MKRTEELFNVVWFIRFPRLDGAVQAQPSPMEEL